MEDSKLAWAANILPPSKTQMAIKWLSQNLSDGEYCVTYVTGSKNYASPSWFVLTNRRLMFISDQLVDSISFGECFQEFDLKNIHDGHFKKKTFSSLGEIQRKVNSGEKVLDHVIPELGNDFISSLLKTVKIRKQADGDIVYRTSNGQVSVIAVGIEGTENAFARLGNQNIDRSSGRAKHLARTHLDSAGFADGVGFCSMCCGFTQ